MAAQAVWGSVSSTRTLPNADQGNGTSNLLITGRWLLSYSHQANWSTDAGFLFTAWTWGWLKSWFNLSKNKWAIFKNVKLHNVKWTLNFVVLKFHSFFFFFFWPNSSVNSSKPQERSTVLTLSETWKSSKVFFFFFFGLILIFFKSQYFQNPTSGSDAKYTSILCIYMCLYQSFHFLYLLGVKLFFLTDFAPGGICREPFQ